MKDKFYELSIKTSNFYDEILELVLVRVSLWVDVI